MITKTMKSLVFEMNIKRLQVDLLWVLFFPGDPVLE